MRRILLLVVALAVLVVVGVGGWYLFIRDEPDKFTLSARDGSQTAKSADELVGTWAPVASDSEAGYRVKEKLARLPAQSDAVGRTSAVTGEVTLAKDGDELAATAAELEVDLTQLKSDIGQRDNKIKDLGLESNRFPKSTFALTTPITVPAAALNGSQAKVDAVGDLTLHGVTKRVTIPLDVQLDGDRIELVGSLTFPFTDFGMSPPNIGGFVTVEPDATLELKLFLAKGAS
jgi:polyisoprenoid-binding protein YceI